MAILVVLAVLAILAVAVVALALRSGGHSDAPGAGGHGCSHLIGRY
jgi:hypothetical protein